MAKDYVINPDRFKNFFNQLDTRRTLLTTVTDLNTKLFNHFVSLEEALNNKSLTLDTQIQKFKEHTGKTLETLRIREALIPEKEVALAGRVQQLMDAGIADIKTSESKKKTLPDSLRMWFRRMDCKGMMEFLLANRKKQAELRVETAMAAEEAVDLLGFVLEAVEDFVELKLSGKKVGGLASTRCACGLLIQAAFPIPSAAGGGGDGEAFCLSAGGDGISRRLKEKAAMVLGKWRGVLSSSGSGGRVSSGEAIMFLTMVIGFGLKDEFDVELLRSLLLEVGSRRDMVKLALALASTHKITDIIEEFVKTGKDVDAVYIVSEAKLTDVFPPVQLLKSCLTKYSKDTPSREDVINELNVTRSVMKCIEDHELESEFSMSGLKKRIAQLERAKAGKKKSGATTATKSPPSNKRSHSRRFGAPTSRPPKSRRVSNTFTAFHQRNHPPPPPPTTYQPSASRYPPPYSYSSPNVYENRMTATPYGVSYTGAHTQNPAGYLQYANHYPAQDIGAGAVQVQVQVQGSGSYGGQMNYGAYDYNTPAASSAPTYPATYNA